MRFLCLTTKTLYRTLPFGYAFALLVCSLFLLLSAPEARAQTPAPAKTVVLIHGAFADGSSWNKIIPILQAKGLNVIAVQNPLSSLADDVSAAKRAIEAAPGPVILVGHSWGGAVITQAGNDAKVAALVYVAAFAPSKDQSANETTTNFPKPAWLGSLKIDSLGFASLTPEAVSKFFAPDLPASETSLMAVTQGPVALKCFDEKITETAWSSKPSWYIVGEKDQMINPELEKAFAKKMNAKTTVLPTSHVPMLSKPKEVADVILDAAGLLKKK